LFQNTGDPTIVCVVHINNMIAHSTILFVLIVLGKFVQTPQVLCDYRWNDYDMWKKCEVWKEDDNYNKYCITVRNQTSAN